MNRYRMMGLVLAVSLVCLAGTVRADTVNLIPNGDFTSASDLSAWTHYAAVGWNDGTEANPSPDGGSVWLNGSGWFVAPALTAPLVEGRTYKYSFLAVLRAGNGYTNPEDTVMVAGIAPSVGPLEVQLTANWQRYSHEFTATAADVSGSGAAVLNSLNYWTGHSSNSGAPCTYGLDSVSLTAVPEPAAMVLAMTGILGLLAYAWRKR